MVAKNLLHISTSSPREGGKEMPTGEDRMALHDDVKEKAKPGIKGYRGWYRFSETAGKVTGFWRPG